MQESTAALRLCKWWQQLQLKVSLSWPCDGWLRLWSLLWRVQLPACVRFWHEVSLQPGSQGSVLARRLSPTSSAPSMVFSRTLWVILYFYLTFAVPTTKTKCEEGGLWSDGGKNVRECSMMNTQRSRSCSQLCQCGGEQLHWAFGSTEHVGLLFSSKKGLLSRAVIVSASLCRIQKQAQFKLMFFTISSNGKTC